MSGWFGRGARRGVGPGLGLLAAVTLTGCSPSSQGAVTLDEPTGRPAVVVELCEDEYVSAVGLRRAVPDGGVGESLWRIQANGQERTDRFVVGRVPPGFTEIDSFDEGDLRGQLLLEAETTTDTWDRGYHGAEFELRDLRTGTLTTDGGSVTAEDVEEAARRNCTENGFVALGLPGWAGFALIGGTLILVGASVVLMLAQLRGIRRAEQRG